MNNLFAITILAALLFSLGCDSKIELTSVEPTLPTADAQEAIVDRSVEVACGQCQFELEGDGCDLAVRIDGKSYFVDGTGIDDHGDAHAADGFCNSIRRAKVSGHLEGDRFVIEKFELEESK